MSNARDKYLAVTGGVGGAKLCLGLAHELGADDVAFLVNTGDDFEHLGLHISPDLDTLMYTLAGLSNTEFGWGRAGESWNCLAALEQFGAQTWFRLGDADLATHLQRTELLRQGLSLSEATARLNAAVGIAHTVLPMSDEPVRTVIRSGAERLAFQHYFVRERCEPPVTGFEFAGANAARPNAALKRWLDDPALAGIIVCPSNPYVSIDPILAVPTMRDLLKSRARPIIAVSPIVGGDAIKGPTAKMMRELQVPSTAAAVARHYAGFVDGFVVDERDAASAEEVAATGVKTTVAQTVMVTLDDRINLARTTMDFIRRLNRGQ